MTEKRELPPGVEPYSQTPDFTAETVPQSLQKEHNIKDGAYGRMRVKAGVVKYFLAGQAEPLAEISAGETFIILPQEVHSVGLSDDAVFHVEFCR